MPDAATLNRQIVGNVGLYYCCYRLSLLGWNVMPTSRNARGIDIVAFDQDGSNFIGIQVKAQSGPAVIGVALGRSLDTLMGDFWVMVNNVKSMEPAAFVLSTADVRKNSVRDKGGKRTYWLPRAAYKQERFREAWEATLLG
jgi:hypothetical protein